MVVIKRGWSDRGEQEMSQRELDCGIGRYYIKPDEISLVSQE